MTSEEATVRAAGLEGPGGVRLFAASGLLAGLLSTLCCLAPLLLAGLGAGAAWTGGLVALAPYRPAFLAAAAASLAAGTYFAYRRPRTGPPKGACARAGPGRRAKPTLWAATALVAAAAALPYLLPAPFGDS